MKQYLRNIWHAFSQFLNVLLLNGATNECLSGRCYSMPWRIPMAIINTLVFWQNNHCRGAFNNDLQYAKDLIEKSKQKGLA